MGSQCKALGLVLASLLFPGSLEDCSHHLALITGTAVQKGKGVTAESYDWKDVGVFLSLCFSHCDLATP